MPTEGPGLGAVAWEGPPTPWAGWTPVEPSGPSPRYQGEAAPGLSAEARYETAEGPRNQLGLRLTVTNRSAEPRTVQPRLLAGRLLHDPLDHGRYRLLRAQVGEKVRTLTLRAGEEVHRWPGAVGWVTAQTKYAVAIVEPGTAGAALVVTRDLRGQPQGWIEWPAVTVPPGGSQSWQARCYAGPLDYRFLDALKLDHAVSLGAFTTVTRLLRAAMLRMTGLLHSYGAAIVLLTVFLSILFYPLTWASFRTMKKMELVQPEIKALQERYRSDPKRLNEEVMKIYKHHRVNPLAGCLPLLLQMPIFIALYQVLSRSPELRGASFFLIRDLAAPDAMLPLPMALPILGSAVNLLPLAMAGVMLLQQRMSQRGRALTEEQRVQQKVFGFMPVLFGVMFYGLPSGLVLYWLLNTSLAVVQQQLVLRKIS